MQVNPDFMLSDMNDIFRILKIIDEEWFNGLYLL
jgi:hypothetical protein